MSNHNETTTNYEHIKALVRDLHMTRNVARPDQLIESNIQITPSTTLSSNHVPEIRRLLVHQTELTCSSDADDDESYTDEGDTHIDDPHLLVKWCTTHLTPKHQNNKRFNHTSAVDQHFDIPSVIITDVNEPQDIFTSTQRRFSQLYSGLRRLSASHTVGSLTNNSNPATRKILCFCSE